MEATSATLLVRLKAGGPARELAWAEFHRRYAPLIAGFALKLGVRPSDVDDLIQDILTGFYAAQPRFAYSPERGRFRGYLKTCVTHAIADRARRGKLKFDPTGPDITAHANTLSDETATEAWEAAWQHERLTRALARLREYYDANATYIAFHKIAIEGLDPATVADQLGLSLDSTYKAKTRCTARLKIILDELDEDEA